HLDIHTDDGQALLTRLVHHAAAYANVVNADDLRPGGIGADVTDGLRRGRVLPRLQRVDVATGDDAANALGVSITRDVHTCDLAPIRPHVVPPLLCRLDPGERNQGVIAGRRELPEHH